jgi:hypothetical protein
MALEALFTTLNFLRNLQIIPINKLKSLSLASLSNLMYCTTVAYWVLL